MACSTDVANMLPGPKLLSKDMPWLRAPLFGTLVDPPTLRPGAVNVDVVACSFVWDAS